MKKNLLKLLTLVLALVMVVTVFAGCKKADEETDAPTQGSEETPTETQEQPAMDYFICFSLFEPFSIGSTGIWKRYFCFF